MNIISLFQVQLQHGGGNKGAGSWEVNIEHTTTNCEEAEEVLIVAIVTGERSRIRTISFHVSCTARQKQTMFLQQCCQVWRHWVSSGRDHRLAWVFEFICEPNLFCVTYSWNFELDTKIWVHGRRITNQSNPLVTTKRGGGNSDKRGH
jgi:hypothetical protein